MYRSIEARYDAKIVTMYGMTEAFPLAFKSVSCDGVPGTSGQVNPAFEVRIVGADGRPLPTGAVGEIACRPKSANAMSMGYVDATGVGSALVVAPHDEWFRTGDLGSFDDDGNLTYVDRAKDSLRRRGENVSSVEVETTVMRHPAVLEAAAVAVPSDLGEDDILVVVTLAPGADIRPRRVVGLLLGPDALLLRTAVSGSARRDTEERHRAGPKGRAAQERSRRRRMGPRGSRLHTQSLGREKTHDDDLPAGVRARRGGRARGHPEPERAAQPVVLRRRLRRLDCDVSVTRGRRSSATGRRSPTCGTPSTAATDNDWSPSTTRSRSTASTPPSTVSRCCSSEPNCAPPDLYRDKLVYERGGWYFTSRELEWDVVPSKDALSV